MHLKQFDVPFDFDRLRWACVFFTTTNNHSD